MDPLDTDLAQLLQDAVSDIEPADRLTEIRGATAGQPRRFGWYAGVLAAAASVTAIAVVTNPSPPKAEDPGPLAQPETHTVAVYYVGESPDDRRRLYREFHQVTGSDDLNAALEEIATPPDDPDYISWWSSGILRSATVADGVIRVEVTDSALAPTEAVVMSDAVLQSLIYTLQAAVEERLPIQFVHDGIPVAEFFGQATSEPLSNGAQLDVLALVSISDPAEGLVVTESFIARGAASSFEGNVPWELRDADGAALRSGHATAGMDTHLISWETEPIDVSDLDPGRYLFVATTDDGAFTDTRTVVVQ